jgi:pyruvate ferredoxin oxidoreductase alpha subunit
VEAYQTEDADVCVIGIGTVSGAIRLAVDRLREEGLKVGSLRLAMMRPFPRQGVEAATVNVRHLIIIDRDVSFGAEGIVAQELKAILFERHRDVKSTGFIAGVGGKDISAETVVLLVKQAIFGAGTAVEAGSTFWMDVLP